MRLIDADALDAAFTDLRFNADRTLKHWGDRQDWCLHGSEVEKLIENAPTVSGWISVKDAMPEEHNSIFANYTHLSKHMWAKESDYVIVYVQFPDGTGRATEGRLQDGKWWTRISPVLEPIVTHWMPLPTPPEVYDEV